MPREIEEQDLARAVETLMHGPEVVSTPSTWVTTSFSTWEPVYDDIRFQTVDCNTSVKEIMNRIYALEIEVYELKEKLKQQQGGFCL